jgi:sugar lactone lactonase YvrE
MKRSRILFTISMIVIFSMLAGLTASTAQTPAQPQVDLGEPGLSYRYVETYGDPQTPYISDTVHLNGPIGIFMDSANNLFVAEETGKRVLKYDSTPSIVWAKGSAGNSAWDIGWGEYIFYLPWDLSLDNDGNVWVADFQRVVEYDTNGVYIQEYNDADHPFSELYGIAFDTAGRMYVSMSSANEVLVYYFIDGTPVYSTTIGGGDTGFFNQPRRIAMNDSDQLYVADSGNGRVQRCTYALGWSCETLDSGLNNPQGLAVDNINDIVYIADTNNQQIRFCMSDGTCDVYVNNTGPLTDLAVDTAGNVYGVCPSCDSTVHKFDSLRQMTIYLGVEWVPYLTDDYHYNRPKVSLDKDRNILITEEYGQRLIKLDPEGNPIWSFGVAGVYGGDDNHLVYPMITATDSSGNIYVPNHYGCSVSIISSGGVFSNTLGTGCGSGDSQFDQPMGVAIDNNDDIYVADSSNNRVSIFNHNLEYIGQINQDEVCDAADNHLCGPQAVAIDMVGNIYVADSNNMRVQVFDSSLQLKMTIGTGTYGNQFDQFAVPNGIAVDAQGKIYVSEWQNYRVQVFNADGAYLTTIGGSWGTNTAQFNGISSVAVDAEGNVYVGDVGHRIQKYAPGVPDWKQVNINGFGSPNAVGTTLASFNGHLYAGTTDGANGTQIWRTADGMTWEPMTELGVGFGEGNIAVLDMIEFDGKLFAGTGWGGPPEIWRTTDGSDWTQVMTATLGDEWNVDALGVYGSQIYAGLSTGSGVAIFRSSTGDRDTWTPVVTGGNGNPNNTIIDELIVFNEQFYALGQNSADGAFVWQSSEDGDTWTQVNLPGFDNSKQAEAVSAAVYDGKLYVGTCGEIPCEIENGQLWVTSNGTEWSPLITDGFGDINNKEFDSLYVVDGALFAIVSNHDTGAQVWRTMDGVNWVPANQDGWGDSNNIWSLRDHASAAFDNQLYIGAFNNANGGEIWRYEPAVTASFTAEPTSGAVPLEVTFTNTSSGTLTASLWDFGDGITSTLTSPVHIYDTTGVYTVTLTADSFGNTDTITMVDLIMVEPQKIFLPVIRR